MYRCQQPPMVQPVVQPVKAKDSFSAHFFRWLRWSAVAGMLIPVGIVFIVQMVWLVQAENELEFKRDMLDRGMNVQEIERVLRASPNSRDRSVAAENNYYTARHAEIESALIKDLATLNMSADDIERVHKAFTATNGAATKNHGTSERAGKDATFVKRLAQSGRSAAEIERLLKVSGKSTLIIEDKQPVVTEKSQQAKVEEALKTLLKSGLTAEDLTRVLKSGDTATEEPKTP